VDTILLCKGVDASHFRARKKIQPWRIAHKWLVAVETCIHNTKGISTSDLPYLHEPRTTLFCCRRRRSRPNRWSGVLPNSMLNSYNNIMECENVVPARRRRYYKRARVIVNKQVFFVAGVCRGSWLYTVGIILLALPTSKGP